MVLGVYMDIGHSALLPSNQGPILAEEIVLGSCEQRLEFGERVLPQIWEVCTTEDRWFHVSRRWWCDPFVTDRTKLLDL